MGRLLTEKGLDSPQLAGPSEAHLVPDRLRRGTEIPSWSWATQRFRTLVEYLEAEEMTVHEALDFVPFTAAWAAAAWSELYRIDQRACEWARNTVLISFTGSYWLDKDSGAFLPPVTYVDRLNSSKQARQKALSRVLEDVNKWRSIRVIGGEGYNGYPRIFLGLYLSSPVTRDVFDPVVDAHVSNCPIADSAAHEIEDIVRVDSTPSHKSRLVHGIGKRAPGLESTDGLYSESWEKQKIATVLHAGGWRPYSFGSSI